MASRRCPYNFPSECIQLTPLLAVYTRIAYRCLRLVLIGSPCNSRRRSPYNSRPQPPPQGHRRSCPHQHTDTLSIKVEGGRRGLLRQGTPAVKSLSESSLSAATRYSIASAEYDRKRAHKETRSHPSWPRWHRSRGLRYLQTRAEASAAGASFQSSLCDPKAHSMQVTKLDLGDNGILADHLSRLTHYLGGSLQALSLRNNQIKTWKDVDTIIGKSHKDKFSRLQELMLSGNPLQVSQYEVGREDYYKSYAPLSQIRCRC